MPDRQTPLAERILARTTGPTRAAAIYGDLLELSTTRTRLWFYTAYIRTLFSLTWRIVLALFVAEIVREFIFNAFHIYLQHTPAEWRTASGPYLLGHMGPLLAGIMSTLWFVLPFAAVRYGLRDRFVSLTFVIAVGTTVAFLFLPWASLLFAAATLALAAAALVSKPWHRPLKALLATLVIGTASLLLVALSSALQVQMRHAAAHTPRPDWPVFANIAIFGFQGSLLAVAVVCSRLHRWLFEPRSS